MGPTASLYYNIKISSYYICGYAWGRFLFFLTVWASPDSHFWSVVGGIEVKDMFDGVVGVGFWVWVAVLGPGF